jgi:polyhydroxyalkanoate synthesis repressor PhaR
MGGTLINNGHGPLNNSLGGQDAVLMNGGLGNGGMMNAGVSSNVVPVTRSNAKTKIIKRYQNRKLYDTQQSCYVTLDDIAKMIRTNEEVMVIDNKTKNDITAATLTQIIFEAEKKASAYAPLFTLREIIQNANGSISSYLAKLGAIPQDFARTEAVVAAPERASNDDLKQSLENRVAKAAAADSTDFANKFASEETPSLPNSNKSLDN